MCSCTWSSRTQVSSLWKIVYFMSQRWNRCRALTHWRLVFFKDQPSLSILRLNVLSTCLCSVKFLFFSVDVFFSSDFQPLGTPERNFILGGQWKLVSGPDEVYLTIHSILVTLFIPSKKKKKYHSSIFYVSCSSSELSTWEGLWKEARHDLHNNRPYRPARAVVVDEQLWETVLSWGDLCGLWRTQHRDILANLDQSVLWPVKVKFKIKTERREERKEQNIPGLQRIRIQGQLKNMGGKPTFFS